jgi:hypothetical protein
MPDSARGHIVELLDHGIPSEEIYTRWRRLATLTNQVLHLTARGDEKVPIPQAFLDADDDVPEGEIPESFKGI